jgi:small subunit ribosomal protein S14
MAKTNMLEREKRRAALVEEVRREAREAQGDDPRPEGVARGPRRCAGALQKLPRDSNPTAAAAAARSRAARAASYRKFGLARTKLREAAMHGDIPGLARRAGKEPQRMSMTDPIADLLTRIRNGQTARKTEVTMPELEAQGRHRAGPEGRGLHRRLQRTPTRTARPR